MLFGNKIKAYENWQNLRILKMSIQRIENQISFNKILSTIQESKQKASYFGLTHDI